MEVDLSLTQLVALAAALGWASGLRLYAVVFITGAIGWLGWVTLPDGLALLQHPVVLGASFLMFLMEFVADKIPGLDTLWDAVHTFIRIPAGGLLAAAVFHLVTNSAVWSVWHLLPLVIRPPVALQHAHPCQTPGNFISAQGSGYDAADSAHDRS